MQMDRHRRRDNEIRIAINGKFALINEGENRIRKTITLCMPQYSAAQIKTYDDSEVEQGHDGNWYEKGHAPQRPLEEIKVAKLIELGTAFEKASQTAHWSLVSRF